MVRIERDDLDEFTPEESKPFGRRALQGDGLVSRREHVHDDSIVDERQQIFFRVDVVVKGTASESDRVAQLGDPSGVISLRREEPSRLVDDLIATPFPSATIASISDSHDVPPPFLYFADID